MNQNSIVYALAFGPDGSLYAGGTYSSAGGVQPTPSPAGTAQPGTPWALNGIGLWVHALAVGTDGSLYAGGRFATAGGVAAIHRPLGWDGLASLG